MNNLDLPPRTRLSGRKIRPQPQPSIDQTFPPPVFVELSARLREAELVRANSSSQPPTTGKYRLALVLGVFLAVIALLSTLSDVFVLQLLVLPLLVMIVVGLAFLSGSWWGRQGSVVISSWQKQRKLARLRAMHRRGDG